MAYVPTYAIRQVHADPKTAFAANTVALIVFMLVQPLFGALSDRIGRKPQLIVFAAGYLIFFYPLMTTLGPSFGSILAVELFGLVLYSMYTSIAPAIMSEQFPTSVRAVGIGTPYNLVVALLGGTTPYLLTWLQSQGHGTLVLLLRAGRRRDHADHLHPHARDGRPEAPLRPARRRPARGASRAFRHRQVRKAVSFSGSPMSAPDTALHFQNALGIGRAIRQER